MTTFVLIPGAGGAASDWRLLVPELRGRGHEAIAVALPAADDVAGLDDYAGVAAAAAGGARDGLVVVAHSLGGLSAPLVCRRRPVERIVLVNAMIPAPGETAADWWANTGQRQARREHDVRNGRDPDAAYDPLEVFFHDVPDDVAKESMAGEPAQSDTPFGEPWPLSAWPEVPTTVLAGREDRCFPVDFQIRVSRERLGITPEVLPGGHMMALSRPGELAAALAG